MAARPESTPPNLLTPGLDLGTYGTDHDHHTPESSSLPQRDNGFLVDTSLIVNAALGRQNSCPQQLPHATTTVECLYWLTE
jgi:hypothetical protein